MQAQKTFELAYKEARKKALEDYRNSIEFAENPSEGWRKTKSLMGKPSNTIKVDTLIGGNTVISTDQGKAEALRTHYAKVSSDESLRPEFLETKNN